MVRTFLNLFNLLVKGKFCMCYSLKEVRLKSSRNSMKMALKALFRKLVVLSRRKVKKSQRMWNKLGILTLSNACVCEHAHGQQRADQLQDLERGPQLTAGAAIQEHVSLGQRLLHRTWLFPPPVASFHF